ncbi:MAG: hypothetical protein KGL39_39420 [Patescibacteria group bacterium]|nr:hypothetical protein [Patescibacteria group bacterium]
MTDGQNKTDSVIWQLDRALNRLCKWRAHFAGWQLGTRSKEDPEAQAVRDHREVTMLLRAEVSALLATMEEVAPGFRRRFQINLIAEVEALEKMYEERWPGVKATDQGLSYDQRAVETMRSWRP